MCGWSCSPLWDLGWWGLWDDYIKILKGRSKGLSVVQKLVCQFAVALAIALFFYVSPGYSTELSVPFFKNFTPDLGIFYIPFAILVIVGCSNAVNLTDGLDGLAIGPTVIAAMAYTVVAWAVGNKIVSEYLLIPHVEGAGELAVLTSSIIGIQSWFPLV